MAGKGRHGTSDTAGWLVVSVSPLFRQLGPVPRGRPREAKPTWIGVEDSHDQLLGAGRDLLVFRKLVSILLDPFVDGVDIFGLERGFANEQCISTM
jgi:hypothetical protein